jgi:fluoride exporter
MGSMLPYLLVGVGGFVGANARFIAAKWSGAMFGVSVPVGTFFVNVLGSFLLGFLGSVLAEKTVANADSFRLALGIGFLGAFTTFSTFEYETHALFEDGSWLIALANMFVSLFFGLIAVRLGVLAARTWM